MIPLLISSGYSYVATIFLCPLFFSLAHVHHAYEIRRLELKLIIIVTLSQILITMIFGTYSSFLFLRTGHMISPLLCHIFCNYMGPPIIPSDHPKKYLIAIMHVIGLGAFFGVLFPLTDPSIFSSIYYNCDVYRYCDIPTYSNSSAYSRQILPENCIFSEPI